MSKRHNRNTSIFFPILHGVKQLLVSSDAHIVSSEGEAVLRDKTKMKKVASAIKKSKKSNAPSKSITVKF